MSEGGTIQRTATLNTDWQDLTTRHESCRESIETNIERFPYKPVQATYVVGAIGAGKSLLLLHGFKHAWTKEGKPAIYLDLSDLIEELLARAEADGKDIVPQSKLHTYLEEICIQKLRQIQKKIDNNENLDSEDPLPNTRRRPSAENYFANLGVENPTEVASKEDELIVLVDEMEEGYKRLDENTEGTTGPLREVVDEIDKGNSRIYLIGAFGYASAHELGEAEARRVKSINLPIIRPRQIHQVLERDLDSGTENYAWWHSRGRPGWLQSALDTKENLRDEVEGHYDSLFDLAPQQISRVEVLDRGALDTHLDQFSRESRDLVAYLLTTPHPYTINDLDEPAAYQSLLEAEAGKHVLCDSSLTPVEEVYRTIEAGFENQDSYHSGISDSQLSQFGERVLQGISNENGEMVFGHTISPTPAQGDKAVDMILRPLVRRMHDIALEELGSDGEGTIEFLYTMTQELDQKSAQDIYQSFGDFFELFSSEADFTVDSHVSIDLETPSIAFPSLITNPRLSFADRETNTDIQYQELVTMLKNMEAASDRLLEFGDILQEDPR
jgi:hypothetical protein